MSWDCRSACCTDWCARSPDRLVTTICPTEVPTGRPGFPPDPCRQLVLPKCFLVCREGRSKVIDRHQASWKPRHQGRAKPSTCTSVPKLEAVHRKQSFSISENQIPC